ncbi:hypothetical protein [Abyssisolibacter fermentans]|nr:hypothetical protein [Abyssisolibacter fermentans]
MEVFFIGRKPKYNKEIKIEDYIAGKGSFYSIAKSIGCATERVRQ